MVSSTSTFAPQVVCPPALPLLGHLPMVRDLLAASERCRDLGDIVKLRLAGREVIVLSHPRDIEEMLVEKHASFHKDWTTRMLQPIIGQGLLINEGASWRRQRRIVQPEFTPKRVEAFVPLFAACSARLAGRLRDRAEVDLYSEMARLTLDVAGRALFGTETAHVAERISELLDMFIRHYMGFMGTTLRLPDWVPSPSNLRVAEGQRQLRGLVADIVRERRAQGADGQDLLSRLLSARDERGEPMPESLLSDEIVTMLLAGHETTALLLTFALMLLGQNRAILAQLRAELEPLRDRVPTADALAQLPYLDAVLKETLRLYPPAYSIGREAIETTSLGGVPLKRGTQVWLFQWAVQRDPRFYREPLRFRPERWLTEQTTGLARFAFFPFGGGPRVCPGAHFALVEAKAALVALLARVDVFVDDPRPPKLSVGATLRPRGVRARLKPLSTLAATSASPSADGGGA